MAAAPGGIPAACRPHALSATSCISTAQCRLPSARSPLTWSGISTTQPHCHVAARWRHRPAPRQRHSQPPVAAASLHRQRLRCSHRSCSRLATADGLAPARHRCHRSGPHRRRWHIRRPRGPRASHRGSVTSHHSHGSWIWTNPRIRSPEGFPKPGRRTAETRQASTALRRDAACFARQARHQPCSWTVAGRAVTDFAQRVHQQHSSWIAVARLQVVFRHRCRQGRLTPRSWRNRLPQGRYSRWTRGR